MPIIDEYLPTLRICQDQLRTRVAVLLALPRAFSARGRLLSLCIAF